MFRAGDLAAVVQPGGDLEFIALGVAHVEVGELAIPGVDGFFQQHAGQLRDPLAVPAGVGTLGVDGVGEQLDDGVQQTLLRLDQLARLDGHGGGAGKLLDEAHERPPRLAPVVALLQLQDQDAEQFLAAAAQGDRQVLAVARQGLADLPFQALLGETLDQHRLRVLFAAHRAGQAQPVVLLLQQIDRTALHPGGFHQAREHAFEHALQAGLAAQGEGDRLEVVDGARHAAQHAAEIAHFGNPRLDAHRPGEIEGRQGADLLGQGTQRPGDALADVPADPQQHQQQRQAPQGLLHQQLAGAGEQFVGRDGDQHPRLAGGEVRQRHPHAVPAVAIHLECLWHALRHRQSGEVPEAGHAQLIEAGQAGFVAVVHQQARQVRIGDHRTLAVHQRQLGIGGLAQAVHLLADVVHRGIHADHRGAVDAAVRQGQADLVGGEEHIGQGEDRALAALGLAVPGTLARIELVVGLVAHPQQVQLVVVVAPFAAAGALLVQSDALH
ncbi:hypothetical protein D3C76_637290 [compost metagenome]